MERTHYQMPDAINFSVTKDFTQIPNELLRNPDVSSKAKVILGILLSNKEGWKSHMVTLTSFMKEGRESVMSGLKELTELGYLIRIKYRNKATKKMVGSFWCYVDIPFTFNFQENNQILDSKGFEIVPINTEKPRCGKPDCGKPDYGLADSNNTNNKNTNNKNTVKSYDFTSSSDASDFITPILFEKFWTIYPKKNDKGKTKTSWNKLCTKNKGKDRPTWITIKKAVLAQKKSDRWSNPEYIPAPTTWINQSRWLDDPAEMILFKRSNEQTPKTTTGYISPNIVYREADRVM